MTQSSNGTTPKETGHGDIQGYKRSLPAPDDPEFLVRMETLCSKLALPLKWCRREASAGRLPCVKVGQRLLFNTAAVAEHLRERAARRNQRGEWLE